MSVLGIRCSNSDYSFCILSGNRDAPVVEKNERVAFPKDYTEPELLKWLHQEMSELFEHHGCKTVGIKKAEGNVKRSNSLERRIQAGAMVILAAAQAGAQAVSRKVNSTIAKDLGLKGKAKYLETQLDTSVIDDFGSYPPKIQEAIYVAWSCM